MSTNPWRPSPAEYTLPGARLIKPAAQGDYDGLCGLYCLINAVRLVLAPHRELRHEEVKAVFAAGVGILARRGGLANAAHSCVTEQDWPKLAARVVKAAQSIAQRPIVLEGPRLDNRVVGAETFDWIEGIVASGKAPCVFIRGAYRHYSVISGYTAASLRLFDSFGYHRLLRTSCSTSNSGSALHRLDLRSMITVSVG